MTQGQERSEENRPSIQPVLRTFICGLFPLYSKIVNTQVDSCVLSRRLSIEGRQTIGAAGINLEIATRQRLKIRMSTH
jgi:hypothetical protein